MKITTVVILAVLIFVVGCATHPKEYEKTHGENSITADVAREQIGNSTTYGIVDAIFGALTGLYTINQFMIMSDYYNDYNDYKKKSENPNNYSESERNAFRSLSREAEKLGDKAMNQGLLWGVGTALLIRGSADCFKASSEWEGELDKLKRSNTESPGTIYSLRLNENTRLGVGYNLINLRDDPLSGIFVQLGIGF